MSQNECNSWGNIIDNLMNSHDIQRIQELYDLVRQFVDVNPINDMGYCNLCGVDFDKKNAQHKDTCAFKQAKTLIDQIT